MHFLQSFEFSRYKSGISPSHNISVYNSGYNTLSAPSRGCHSLTARVGWTHARIACGSFKFLDTWPPDSSRCLTLSESSLPDRKGPGRGSLPVWNGLAYMCPCPACGPGRRFLPLLTEPRVPGFNDIAGCTCKSLSA